MTSNSAKLIFHFKWLTFLRFPRHNFLAPGHFYIFPEALVKLYLKYPRSTTQGANIKEGSMDSRTGMARRMMWLIRTKMFLFWKNDHFHLKKTYSIMMSIVFNMLLQWPHPHVFHTVGQADVRRNHLSGLRCHSSRVPWLSWGLALISCKLSHLWW